MHYSTGTLSEIQTYAACFFTEQMTSKERWSQKDPTLRLTQVFSLCYSKVKVNLIKKIVNTTQVPD